MRKDFVKIEGDAALLRCFEYFLDRAEYVAECARTLLVLSVNDDLCKSVAQGGMSLVMSAMQQHIEDRDVLQVLFRLVSSLCFVPSNIQEFMQCNGLQSIVDVVLKHTLFKPIMIQCINTLESIATSGGENAVLLKEESGLEIVNQIAHAYENDADIQRAAKGCHSSVQAAENLLKSASLGKGNTATQRDITADSRKADPLEGLRNMLQAGAVLNIWNKGSRSAVHIFMSDDWRSICWRDPRSTNRSRKLGAVDLRSVLAVTQGMAAGHERKGLTRRTCDPECAFAINTDKRTLYLEGTHKSDAKRWYDAFHKLIYVFRSDPKAIAKDILE